VVSGTWRKPSPVYGALRPAVAHPVRGGRACTVIDIPDLPK
jgi:hypothetical protein